MGVGGELLGCDGEIECRLTIRFSELYDLKECKVEREEKCTAFIGVWVSYCRYHLPKLLRYKILGIAKVFYGCCISHNYIDPRGITRRIADKIQKPAFKLYRGPHSSHWRSPILIVQHFLRVRRRHVRSDTPQIQHIHSETSTYSITNEFSSYIVAALEVLYAA